MRPELIKEALKANGVVVARNPEGKPCYINSLIKMWRDGEYVTGVLFETIYPVVRYCRPIDEFQDFTYLHNEVFKGP